MAGPGTKFESLLNRLSCGSAVLVCLWLAGCASGPHATGEAARFRGNQIIRFDNFARFASSPGTNAGETVLTSPLIRAGLDWDELVASWNVGEQADGYLIVEARAVYPDHATKYYLMGRWSPDRARHPRESVLRQKDTEGDVDTDTLKLKAPCRDLQIRLTLGGDPAIEQKLKLLTLCLTDTRYRGAALPPNQRAWGKTLAVPERSQMAYPNGGVLCSPTTISMIMSYWASLLNRPELDQDVPEVAKAVFDTNWKGTGNWVFNTAYAGSYPGMTAYVSRMSDISELEDLVTAGVPVGLSICYNRLRGKPGRASGHLVVCVGFTENGEVVLNDPGTTRNVRKVFPRSNLIHAWAYSKNAAYLIYPDGAKLPRDRFGHWPTRTSR